MEELKPSLSQLTKVFFKIGNTTFGGGYVTMGMMGREMVETRQWLKASEFDLAFALARVTPGTNLLAFCAAVGAGAISATSKISIASSGATPACSPRYSLQTQACRVSSELFAMITPPPAPTQNAASLNN